MENPLKIVKSAFESSSSFYDEGFNEDVITEEFVQQVPIREVDEVACVRSKYIEIDDKLHERQNWTVSINDRQHNVRVTKPAISYDTADDIESAGTIIHLPGLTEMTDAGSGWHLHNALARVFPDKEIVTIGTEGVNKHGERLSFKDAVSMDFEDMAEDRLALVEHFSNGNELTVAAISMGTILVAKMVELNLRREPEDRVDIDNLLFVSPAIFEPDEAKTVLPEFLLHMTVNGVLTAIRHPEDVAKCANLLPALLVLPTAFEPEIAKKVAGQLLPHKAVNHLLTAIKHPKDTADKCAKAVPGLRHDLAYALTGNVRNIIQGTERDVLKRIVENYPTGFIKGAKDPLTKSEKLRMLELSNRDNVTFFEVPGEGHALPLHAKLTALLMKAALEDLSQEPTFDQAQAA